MTRWRRTTACERAAQWISLDLDGELGRLEQAALARHLRRCDRCRASSAEIGGFTALLREAPPVEPARAIVVADACLGEAAGPRDAPRRRARARDRGGDLRRRRALSPRRRRRRRARSASPNRPQQITLRARARAQRADRVVAGRGADGLTRSQPARFYRLAARRARRTASHAPPPPRPQRQLPGDPWPTMAVQRTAAARTSAA